MAAYEREFLGDFNQWEHWLATEVPNLSRTTELIEVNRWMQGNLGVVVYGFERYSMIGESRVSLTITLAGTDDKLWLSALSTGGSQAILFKINTWGEGAFLDEFVSMFERALQA